VSILRAGAILATTFLCLAFLIYSFAHRERTRTEEDRTNRDKFGWCFPWSNFGDRSLSGFYLWFLRIMTSVACILLIYAIFEFALNLGAAPCDPKVTKKPVEHLSSERI
jgi:hypothetical protein